MTAFENYTAMKKTVREYNRLMDMATRYLNSEEGKMEDPDLQPMEWVLGVLLAEKLHAAGEIDDETLNSIPGYERS